MNAKERVEDVLARLTTDEDVVIDKKDQAALIPFLVAMAYDGNTPFKSNLTSMYGDKSVREVSKSFFDALIDKDGNAAKLFKAMTQDVIRRIRASVDKDMKESVEMGILEGFQWITENVS